MGRLRLARMTYPTRTGRGSMALLFSAVPSPAPPPDHGLQRRNPSCVHCLKRSSRRFLPRGISTESGRSSISGSTAAEEICPWTAPGWLSLSILSVAAPAVILLAGFGAAFSPLARACSLPARPADCRSENEVTDSSGSTSGGEEEDEDWKREFEKWKSKTYALTVPLRIVALRGSVPPSWIKDFIQIQGKRLKLTPEFRGNLDTIYSDLSSTSKTGRIEPKSAMAADVISIGDSWLPYAISERLIEPIQGTEEQDWFQSLNSKWKVYLRRNDKGDIDECGKIWAVPYRWGCMVIAYKKNKFRKHNLAPIKDWDDLWREELRGKVVMVDSPREVVGAVLRSMGASYNTKNVDQEVPGGVNAVAERLAALQRQVRLFDNANYLKAFATADAWVAVGWSSDVVPMARRQSGVSVIVPESGTSLWADLWAIPAATRFPTEEKIGGRVRGPSPMVNQWIEFCLQATRALPYQQQVNPGSSPLIFNSQLSVPTLGVVRGQPAVDTNLVGGAPPPEILRKCEFLEPLSEESMVDHQRLVAGMVRSGHGWIGRSKDFFSKIYGMLARSVHS